MKKIIILLCFSMVVTQSISNHGFSTAKGDALSGSFVAKADNHSAIFYNPAGLSYNKHLIVNSTYARIFNQNYLPYLNLSITSKKTKIGSFGLSISQLQVDYLSRMLSRERVFAVSHSFFLQEDQNSSLSLGYTMNMNEWALGSSAGTNGDGSNGIQSLNNIYVYGMDVGIQASLRQKHSLGTFLKNINIPKVGGSNSLMALAREIALGAAYSPIENLTTSLTITNELGNNNSSIKGGIEYALNQYFTWYVGLQSNPNVISTGFSMHIKNILINHGFKSHPVLPSTHIFEIGYKF